MKITLTRGHSIRGKVEPKGTVVDINEGVAQDLVDRGIAEKPTAKKSSKTDK